MTRHASMGRERRTCECGHAYSARRPHHERRVLVGGSVWLLCPDCQLPKQFNRGAYR